ncbi:hypothetical protein ERO13_A01G220800v2 [Gossypium hirsutum]|nr:hypothetical protein ERO13_A01G220800v2 [Gossypium hirsutum]
MEKVLRRRVRGFRVGKVVTDRSSLSNHSKGYGFVRYSNLEDAKKGMEGMDGQFLDGRVIFTEYAKPKDTL